MLLRRVSIILASSLLLAATVFAGTALADDSVHVSNIRVTPSSLSGDGQVSVTVNVSVDTSALTQLSNAYIAGPGVDSSSVTKTDIQIGESQDLSCSLHVTQAQLGTDIPLTVKWDGGSAPFTVTVNSSSPSTPQVNFTRTFDKLSAAKGETVTLTYKVANTGLMDITNLVITDEGVDSAMSLTKDALAAGNTATFTYSYVITADFTSVPHLSYKAGGSSYSVNGGSAKVSLKVAQLEAALLASPESIKSGDEVSLLLTLTNTGNVKLTNVLISEKTLGNKLYAATSLDIDASKQFSKNVVLTQTTSFQYVITATDDTGHNYTFNSNTLAITVSSASGLYDIEISASADALQLAGPGDVNFLFTVTNKGATAVANASILDQDGKTITTFGSLPPGVTTYSYTTGITNSSQFVFSIVVPGEAGNYEVYSKPTVITVADMTASPALTAQESPAPTTAPTDTSTSASGTAGSRMGTLLTALLVVGALIAITIVVLVAMIIADKRHKKRK